MMNKKIAILLALLILPLMLNSQIKSDVNVVISPDAGGATISKHIYGHFSEHLGRCIYGGYWVGEDSEIPNTRGIRNDVVNALRQINIPNLRWPGGCFADEYHWMDGIGPAAQRPKMINTHWGGVVENNRFGTHEFMDLCEQLGTEPVICGNVGSGSVEEMADWVEYLNFDGISPMADLRRANGQEEAWGVKFWDVGNENWGCGGNMTAEFYANQYRRYATYCRDYGENQLYRIAGGANSTDLNWTETLMKNIPHHLMDGISLHYYTVNWSDKGSATEFGEELYFDILRRCYDIEKTIDRHIRIMDKYDPEKNIALVFDEWGTWYEVEPGTNPGFLYQQNTMRDAMVAALTLNYLNERSDRIKMANIAQTVNVLQALILTEEEKMILTPTYHVYDMFQVHQESQLIPVHFESPQYSYENENIDAVSISASMDKQGKIHLSIVNIDPGKEQSLSIYFNVEEKKKINGQILRADAINAHNTFDTPDRVTKSDFSDASIKKGKLEATIPAASIVVLSLE